MADRTILGRWAARSARTALLGLALAGPARAQGVSIALTPAIQNVAPGAQFDVDVDVTQAGAAFNGFRVVVSFDPTALTFVPLVPLANQQGCLMTGGCSAACGQTFHQFAAAADSLVASDVLLCDQVAVTGPGAIYHLRFQAADSVQATTIHVRRALFYDAGLFVTPVTTADCQIGIGELLAVGAGAPVGVLRVQAAPNPAWGRVSLLAATDRAGAQTLDVLDPAGRLVRRIASGWQPAGERTLAWDGTDAGGRGVPAGVYLVRLRAGDRVTWARVALLR